MENLNIRKICKQLDKDLKHFRRELINLNENNIRIYAWIPYTIF